ncbi:hypothetical protein O181_119362 [Austropuccinia psidii MF-1]|uniref:Uncharacterized protein n=1 Tax=Austropuccinia psidii MF-1 TaxID=1389203 RepID=A0A9Q3KH39_9BASI|nr:hypothetical protein [Austropuccinia psidii MF-1]
MAELISYTKRPVKRACINFKASLSQARIIHEPFLAEDLLQILNHLSPRSDQTLGEVVECFKNITYTTDPTSLLPPDHSDTSKVTPDSGGLTYVFNHF